MDAENIFDVNQNDFEDVVIQKSSEKLIVVDFWAPWCGPCKQLSPILEKVARENQNIFDLVKINIDENQQIAAQLRIQSIPTVFAFKEKKVVNAFQGVISEKDFIDFIEKSTGSKLKEDMSSFYDEVKQLISVKNYEHAKDKLLTFFSQNEGDVIAIALYLECLLSQKEFKEINEFLASLDEEMKKQTEIKKIIKKLKIIEESKKNGSIDKLIEKHKKEPQNIQIILEISEYYFSEGDYESSFSTLINNYYKNKEKIKKQLVEFFEVLGNEHESTKTYRKKLSSLIFS